MTPPKVGRPKSTRDLLPSENRFVTALQQLEYGRFEGILIHQRELVTDPWPIAVRLVKFGEKNMQLVPPAPDFLEVRRGLPVSMEIIERKAA